MPNRIRRVLTGFFPLLVLGIVNFATFARHYRGKSTFPWDFLGGYHAQAFGWFDAGSIFAPPSWLPWSDMGFPAFLAIQSGAWYLPLALLDAAGVTYSIHVATMVQVLHVLLGAVGMYCLGRVLGWGKLVALFAAVIYHYGATFYSNQQHVDIIRAVAWLPWLLLSLHPSLLSRKAWAPLLAAVVLSQLLISGYPGNIISSAYACVLWVLSFQLALAVQNRDELKNYTLKVAVAVIGGTLMSMPKWLPVALFSGSGLGMDPVAPTPIMAHHLLTLVMPYQFDGLSNDLTMRALWLPAAALWGIAFARMRDRLVLTGLGFITLALVMGFVVPRSELLQQVLPGARMSRFPVSDWRPVLHLGIILVGASGWKRLLEQQLSLLRTVVGAFSVLAAIGLLVIAAIRFGYPAQMLTRVLAVLFVLMALSMIAGLFQHGAIASRRRTMLLPALLLITTALDGYSYYRSQPSTWRPAWTKAAELDSFGGEFDGFVAQQREGALKRRPARYQLGENAAEVLLHKNNSRYNRCWYAHSFCTFGYNNLRLSEPHRKFSDAVGGEGGDQLARFAARPQQLLILSGPSDDRIPALDGPDDASLAGESHGVSVNFLSYGSDAVDYRISTQREIRVVENEIWWPGWAVSLCTEHDCRAEIPVVSTSQALRSWQVPPGNWTVKLRYHPPSLLPAYLCVLIGLLMAIGVGFVRLRIKDAKANA